MKFITVFIFIGILLIVNVYAQETAIAYVGIDIIPQKSNNDIPFESVTVFGFLFLVIFARIFVLLSAKTFINRISFV